MARVQITQERLSAALRAITGLRVALVQIEKRVIARSAGSYSASVRTCAGFRVSRLRENDRVFRYSLRKPLEERTWNHSSPLLFSPLTLRGWERTSAQY